MPSVSTTTHSTYVNYTSEPRSFSYTSEPYTRHATEYTTRVEVSVTIPPFETLTPEFYSLVTVSSYVTQSVTPTTYTVPDQNFEIPRGSYTETSPDPSFTTPPFERQGESQGTGTTPRGSGSGGASVDP